MPPKRMENQPSLDAIVDEEMDNAVHSDGEIDSRAGHSARLRRLVQEKGKLPITFRRCDGRPVGNYAPMFTTELGIIVKTFAPLQIKWWKKVTEEQKIPMFDRLQNFFDVDVGTGPDSVRKEIDTWMGKIYRDNRTKMHTQYKKMLHLPWEMRIEKIPRKFHGSEEDWIYLCSLFEDEKFKGISKKNADNRSLLKTNHCGGSKSFVRFSYETGEGPKRVNRIELYKKTHWTEKNGWAEGAEAIYNKLVQRFNEIKEAFSDSMTDDENLLPDEIEISELVCDEVLGKRSGYIPGLGHGPKPIPASCDDSSRRATNAKLRQELQSTQGELESTRTSLQSAHENIKSLKENMEAYQRMTMQIFQRIAPTEVQSLMEVMSSSTPSL